GVQGPMRVGCLGMGTGSRWQVGAGCYGMLELSGSLWERPVTVGNADGRAFTGLHGNGALTAGGDADVSNWPGTSASGAGVRGGYWADAADDLRASDRSRAARTAVARNYTGGGRFVRLAP
ncbi:MAG: hypothetical protein V1798_03550, partial [Pseudomonadota bacterium]